MHKAHTAMAVFRLALTLQPRLSRREDSQPPAMPPASDIKYTITSGGPKCF
jgi:hypothetical protein